MVRVRRYKIRGGDWGLYPLDRWDVQEVISFLQKDPRNTEQINRIFQRAIKNKDFLMIQTLLWNRVKIEPLNEANQTAIHLAVTHDYFAIIDRLFRHCNNDVNHTDVNGFTHFHIACITGKTDIVERFVKNGVDVNLRFRARTQDERNDFTALHFAVKNAKVKVVELLLKRQANADAKDFAGRTPLHHACGFHDVANDMQKRTLEIIRLLIKYGADVNAKDRNDDTPLCRIFYDDSTSYSEKRAVNLPMYIISYAGGLCQVDRKFIHQLRTRQTQKLKLLLENGVDVAARVGGTGDTILHRLVRDLKASRNYGDFRVPIFEEPFHVEMIEALVEHGVDLESKNDKGETPMSVAASLLSADVVEVLLKHGADVRTIRFDYFYHPKTIPCLKAVENLMAIAAMRESRGHHLSQSENLTIIKLFVANTNQDWITTRYDDFARENGWYKLQNLLELGTDDNVIKSLDKISKLSEYLQDIFTDHVYVYLDQLRKIGLPISERLEVYLLNNFSSKTSGFPARRMDYDSELEKMKSLRLRNNKPLSDLLTAPPAELYSMLKTGEHKDIYDSVDYPGGSRMVEGHFAKCLVRRFILKAANDFVRYAASTPLPDPCCERISTYLSNEELLNLCLAIGAPRARSTSNESAKSQTS